MSMPYEPMLCQPGSLDFVKVNDLRSWRIEPKLDGMRIIAVVRGGQVELWTRRKRKVTKQFPEVVEDLSHVPYDCVLDGELVVGHQMTGVSHMRGFEMLVKRANTSDPVLISLYSRNHPATFWAFDLLELMVAPTHGLELAVSSDLWQLSVSCDYRRLKLCELMSDYYETEYVRSNGSAHVAQVFVFDPESLARSSTDKLEDVFAIAVQTGFEGIVCKRLGSTYQPGVRSPDWVKIKKKDMVDVQIIGVTKSDSGPFGALIMVKDGKYYGKVGTGFSVSMRQSILLGMGLRRTLVSPVKLPRKVVDELLMLMEPMWAEVSIMGEMTGGSPRHPVWVRWRAEQDA